MQQAIISALQTGAWAAVTGAAFAYTFYAKARAKDKETFDWKKFLSTVGAGAVLGFIAGAFKQDFAELWGMVGGFTGSLLREIYKALKHDQS